MTAQTEFSSEELLASHTYAEPLELRGVRCHGGFDEDGHYVSPRTRFRAPAIEAWEAQRLAAFGTPKLDAPLAQWPEPFPDVAQTKLLLSRGVTGPTVATLTRIGTVEGFGGMLRLLPVPDLEQLFAEDIRGTAIAHIPRGLFEAHARDEAGFETEAGHDQMWFLARDIAFDDPVTEDERERMLERMGIVPAGGGADRGGDGTDAIRRILLPQRLLPDDIPWELEMIVTRMVSLLFIEVAAFHGFRWAEAVLGDPELTSGEGAAARIVSYIRADETPHVAYLETALSEMRDRTWVGTRGRYDGAEMVSIIWDSALEQSRGARRRELLAVTMREIERAVADRADRHDLIEELFSMGSVERLPDGTLVDRAA